MARETIIPAKTVQEEIHSYKHVYPSGNKSGHISIVVGSGTEVDGVFVYKQNQDMVNYIITGNDYITFLATKPKFNRADLWQAIDILRNRTN